MLYLLGNTKEIMYTLSKDKSFLNKYFLAHRCRVHGTEEDRRNHSHVYREMSVFAAHPLVCALQVQCNESKWSVPKPLKHEPNQLSTPFVSSVHWSNGNQKRIGGRQLHTHVLIQKGYVCLLKQKKLCSSLSHPLVMPQPRESNVKLWVLIRANTGKNGLWVYKQ